PGHVLADNKARGNFSQPFYVVVTDFMAHATWLVPGVERYYVPGDLTERILLMRGVPPDHIAVTGIPVRLEMTEEKAPYEVRARHDLPGDLPVISLFGGGLDIERVRLMVTQLLDGRTPGMLVVVAGRNEGLEEALADLSDGP